MCVRVCVCLQIFELQVSMEIIMKMVVLDNKVANSKDNKELELGKRSSEVEQSSSVTATVVTG